MLPFKINSFYIIALGIIIFTIIFYFFKLYKKLSNSIENVCIIVEEQKMRIDNLENNKYPVVREEKRTEDLIESEDLDELELESRLDRILNDV